MKKSGSFHKTNVELAAINWISQTNFTYSLNLTLKKYSNGIYISRIIADKVIKQFHDRLAEKLYGRRKRKIAFPFFATYELGGGDDRPHFHIEFNDLKDTTYDEMLDIIRRVTKKIEWIYEQRKLEKIYNVQRLTEYNIYSGIDSVDLATLCLDNDISQINRISEKDYGAVF